MTANVGNIDRILRAAVGALLLLLVIFGSIGGGLAWVAGVVGVVMLATAGMKFCPAYRLLGVNTCQL